MKRHLLKLFKNIDDLKPRDGMNAYGALRKDQRENIQIGVIDDRAFEAAVNLRNYGYSLTEIGDIKDIREVEKYSIILCDLMDVGINFDTKYQGASIIAEIKRNYPAIIVVAYTGASIRSEPSRHARQSADRFIKKDADIQTWVRELDLLIEEARDPKAMWSRVRSALASEGVATSSLLLLEHAFVDSLQSNDGEFKAMKAIITKIDLGNAANNVISGVISSSIFRAIVGL